MIAGDATRRLASNRDFYFGCRASRPANGITRVLRNRIVNDDFLRYA